MSRILEDFGLKKRLNLTIKVDKSDFVKMLESKVKPNRLFFFDKLDNKQRKFYGTVNENGFWLRKADRSIPNCPWASATGIIKKVSNQTIIELEIKGWNWFTIVWLSFMTLIFGLALSDALQTNSFGIIIVFGPIFLSFYLFAIFTIRRGVRRFKRYLTTELNE